MKLSEIAEFLKGEFVGDSNIEINGLAKIESAKAGELTFLANKKYSKYLDKTNASAVIVSKTQQFVKLPHIKVDDPYLAFHRQLHKKRRTLAFRTLYQNRPTMCINNVLRN